MPRSAKNKLYFLRGPLRSGNAKLAAFTAVGLIAIGVILFFVWPGWQATSNDLDAASETDYSDLVQLPTQLGKSWNETDDPTSDGWQSEAFQDQAKKKLNKIGEWLASGKPLDPGLLQEVITGDFACSELRPSDPVPVVKTDRLVVDRAANLEERIPVDSDLALRGVEGFQTALDNVRTQLTDAQPGRFQFKIFRVVPQPDGDMVTRQLFTLVGQSEKGTGEQHAQWGIRWSNEQPPRLKQVWLESFEESRGLVANRWLTDVTRSVLGQNESYQNQMLWGLDYWFERVQDQRYSAFIGISGISVGDVNGDGLDDVYVCQEMSLPNRLYLQQTDGTLVDASASWGVDWLQASRSALLLDLDNDADQDLAVAVMGGIVIAENTGQKFELRDVLPCSDDTTTLCAADYDLDGKLDLYVCANFSNTSLGNELPGDTQDFVIHDANDGGANNLFRNEINSGRWTFTDVTSRVGLDENNRRYSWAAAWEDVDGDGDADLYVANDFGRDNLYRNDLVDGQRQFVDIAESANIENAASGMSTTYGDYDRDGNYDIFVSNMFSSAGNRIAFQQQFKPDAPAQIRDRLARLARGNTLMRNRGNGTFDDVSQESGTEMGRWAWGSLFGDLNNDGWPDLVVANGFVTTEDTGDL